MSAVRIEITDQMKPNLCGGPEQSFQKHFPAGLQGHLDQNTWAMFTNDIEGELQPHTSRLRTWTRLSCGIVSIGMVIFFIGFLIQFVGINRSFYRDEDETGGISIPRTFSLVIGTSVAGFITMFVGATVRVLIVSRMNGQILSALQRICSRYTEISGLTFAAVQEALLAPAQLNQTLRGGDIHRLLGRVMLLSAATLMVGYMLIDANNLFADHVDFQGHGGSLAEAADSFNASHLSNIMPSFNLGGVRFIAAWFVFTGLKTFLAVTGPEKDVAEHRRWAYRHIASGLWVAAQRPLFAVLRLASGVSTAAMQAEHFYVAAYIVTALYVLGAEVFIRQTDERERVIAPES